MIPPALRRQVRERASQRCEYCQLPDILPALVPFHLEHIVARQHGGSDDYENLAWACHRCNERKGTNLSGVDPDTGQVVRLFHPRTNQWERHFALDGMRVAGLSPAGRATVWLLEMNAERRLALRNFLKSRGLY